MPELWLAINFSIMYTHRVQTCFKVIFSIVDENFKVVFLNVSSSDEFQL